MREVRASREHIANLETMDKLKDEKIALLSELYRLSQQQNTELRDSLAHERAAGAAREVKITKLEDRLEKVERRKGGLVGTVLKGLATYGTIKIVEGVLR